jgi:hypothetical protein
MRGRPIRDKKRPAKGRCRLLAFVLLLGCFTTTAIGRAQSLGPDEAPASPGAQPTEPALLLDGVLSAAPLQELPPAAVGAADQLAALVAWNATAKVVQVGFPRALPTEVTFRLGRIAVPPGAPRAFASGLLAPAGPERLAWGTHIKVASAYRLGLHLSDVHLPAGVRMWVAAKGQPPHGFGLEGLSPAGDLWTPIVEGESILFEIHLPAAAADARFTIRQVDEIVDLRGAPGTAPSSPPR